MSIAAAVAACTVPRWVGILKSELSVRPHKKKTKWKFIVVGALIGGCMAGGLLYLLEDLLGMSHFPAPVSSMFLGLGFGSGVIAYGDDS